MAIKGKDFIISIEVGGVRRPICYATDCVIDLTYGTRKIADPTTHWRNYLGDDAGYTLQVPGVVAYKAVVNYAQIKAWADQRQRVRWYATAFENGGVVHTGEMLITGLNLTSQMRDVVKFDMSAIGCGPLDDQYLPINTAVYLADGGKQRLAGCPNPYPVSVYWYDANGGIGDFIGIALNADNVITLFNEYAGNQYYQLTGYTTGCDFNLQSQWDAPFVPDVVYAIATPGLGLSPDQNNNLGLSPDQDNDQQLSPGYA
ncbi:hypothetical protein [Chitinophaga sp.]|uniref:hypothetical protein n=1 Tax=Chitinophaga sp. TaxID=1869181 RepID=UPI0031DA0F76